jgi:hypothetical protein
MKYYIAIRNDAASTYLDYLTESNRQKKHSTHQQI